MQEYPCKAQSIKALAVHHHHHKIKGDNKDIEHLADSDKDGLFGYAVQYDEKHDYRGRIVEAGAVYSVIQEGEG